MLNHLQKTLCINIKYNRHVTLIVDKRPQNGIFMCDLSCYLPVLQIKWTGLMWINILTHFLPQPLYPKGHTSSYNIYVKLACDRVSSQPGNKRKLWQMLSAPCSNATGVLKLLTWYLYKIFYLNEKVLFNFKALKLHFWLKSDVLINNFIYMISIVYNYHISYIGMYIGCKQYYSKILNWNILIIQYLNLTNFSIVY